MWLLGRLLPVFIGSQIPAHNLKWQLFLTLIDIMDILFARRIDDTPSVLYELIKYHLTSFISLYPNQPVIPKMDFFLHTPRIMME